MQTVAVLFSELKIGDAVVVHDQLHNAHGARGTVYWLDSVTRLVSVVTDGYVDTWEGYSDGLEKLIGA